MNSRLFTLEIARPLVDSNRVYQETALGKMALSAFLLALLGLSPMASAASWNYSDTDWSALGSCGGDTQSPINLTEGTAQNIKMTNFSTSMGYKIKSTGYIQNTGYSLKWSADESHGASIMGSPLNNTYILNQFHLHWGSEVGQGSEHCVDNYCYDAELHLVHYNSIYDNISHALMDNQTNSLSVVGILIKEVTEFDQFNVQDSESIKNLKMAAQYLARPHKGPGPITADLTVRPAEFIMDIGELTGFYHYAGSLTTPGCNEVVQWIVYDKPLYVQRNGLLAALRMNKDEYGEYLQDNFRPLVGNTNTLYHYMA